MNQTERGASAIADDRGTIQGAISLHGVRYGIWLVQGELVVE